MVGSTGADHAPDFMRFYGSDHGNLLNSTVFRGKFGREKPLEG
jgi:hypothetical protein